MADLYLAIRSDRRGIVKIGRSDNPYRRCDSLAASHCFRVLPAVVYPGAGSCEAAVHSVLGSTRVEGGPGREWFAVTLKQASDAVHDCLPPAFEGEQAEGPGANAWRAAEFIERLTPVAGPKHATEQAEIDALAERLYGNQWQGVIHVAGLLRHRCRVGSVNRYFYHLQFPDCPRLSYVAIKDASTDCSEEDAGFVGLALERVDRPDSALLERLAAVAGPSRATEQAEVDALAEELYGNRWQGVIQAAGLVRQRRKVDGVNRYFYQLQLPGSQASYMAIKEDMSVGPSTELLEATVRD